MQRLKTAQVNLRIDPELKKAAERAAADDQRSLTSLVEKLLVDHLKASGHLPKQPGGERKGIRKKGGFSKMASGGGRS